MVTFSSKRKKIRHLCKEHIPLSINKYMTEFKNLPTGTCKIKSGVLS